MLINEFSFSGEGMTRVYDNNNWTVGIKNWKPANDISGIDCLERHNLTDELFVLLDGSCTLIYANESEQGLLIEKIRMEAGKVYSIPASLWHNTITEKNTKLILIENSSTSMENSDIFELSKEQIAFIQSII